jgi:hypothetical protein
MKTVEDKLLLRIKNSHGEFVQRHLDMIGADLASLPDIYAKKVAEESYWRGRCDGLLEAWRLIKE